MHRKGFAMTEEYKITSSPSWKWMRGIWTKSGKVIESVRYDTSSPTLLYMCTKEHDGYECKYVHEFHEKPDLSHPATQGAIVFGIFQPLGIHIRPWSSSQVEVRIDHDSKYRSGLPELDLRMYASVEEAITAVFQALDVAAGGTGIPS